MAHSSSQQNELNNFCIKNHFKQEHTKQIFEEEFYSKTYIFRLRESFVIR